MKNAIRGIENLVIGREYSVVYSHLSNEPRELGSLLGICKPRNGYSAELIFQKDRNCYPHHFFAGDCGVEPYGNGYHPTNYLIETYPQRNIVGRRFILPSQEKRREII